MSFEVEVKYRVEDHDGLARKLRDLGGTAGAAIEHEDAYWDHPARDFAQTREALRIRRIGARNHITYKGPKLGGPTKTREEIEIACGEGDEGFQALSRLFENLGFHPVAVVRKSRRPFHLKREGRALEVVLDEAEGLGRFAEVETIATTSADLPAAQAAVLDLAQTLGLTQVEPRSYLRMALERTGAADGGSARWRNRSGQT